MPTHPPLPAPLAPLQAALDRHEAEGAILRAKLATAAVEHARAEEAAGEVYQRAGDLLGWSRRTVLRAIVAGREAERARGGMVTKTVTSAPSVVTKSVTSKKSGDSAGSRVRGGVERRRATRAGDKKRHHARRADA